jgi:hypothetical protein
MSLSFTILAATSALLASGAAQTPARPQVETAPRSSSAPAQAPAAAPHGTFGGATGGVPQVDAGGSNLSARPRSEGEASLRPSTPGASFGGATGGVIAIEAAPEPTAPPKAEQKPATATTAPRP